MRIDSIRMRNFRCFEDVSCSFDDKFTLLIGANAAGKTAVLDALSVALGAALISVPQASGVSIQRRDVRLTFHEAGETGHLQEHYPTRIEAAGALNGHEVSWNRALRSPKGRTTRAGGKALHDAMGSLMRSSANGEDVLFPLIGYYGAGRLWLEQRPNRLRVVDSATRRSRYAGYANCLAPSSSARHLVAWIKRLALIEIQSGKHLKTLAAIYGAMTNTVEDAREAYYDFDEDDVLIRFDNHASLPLRLLSDGQRSMAAMAADIAMRCSILNPHLSERARLCTPGIVLIDELDLHLHPRWQRNIVRDLSQTFPKLQFVSTSHSPFIVQSMSLGGVINLDEEQYDAEPIYEQSVEDVAENVMGVEQPQRSKRFRDMVATAEEYYKLIDDGFELHDADLKKEKLRDKLNELEEPFADNPAYVALLRLQRSAKNL